MVPPPPSTDRTDSPARGQAKRTPSLDEVGWVVRQAESSDAPEDGPSLADLAGLAEELGYPLRYVAGDASEDEQGRR